MVRYRNTMNDTIRESETPMGYPYVEEAAEGQEIAAKTADAILADVGDDAALAGEALATERAREQPRTTLVAKLERIAKAADSE